MSGQWKPGDVAMVTYSDGTEAVSLLTDRGDLAPLWIAGDKRTWARDGEMQAHPLVVIDPEDVEAVGRLVSLYNRQFPISDGPEDAEAMADALREFANPTPPKPDEPQGLGAVVRDAEGKTWVKVGKRSDWYQAHGKWAQYHSIDAVEVLSEGVTP